MKKNCDFKSVTLLASALLVPLSTLAANQTKSGAINLLSTFECISVRAAFSGDDNANNSATISFRKRGTGSWLDAYPPFIDRRATLPDGASNDYANQARGSIVGLTPDTAYDVLISWSDPDGSSGSSSITNTISTLSLVPPANGKKLWVDALVSSEGDGTPDSPYQTIATALQGAKPGDTINVRAGSYAPFVWSKSGNATNYIVLKSVAGTNAVILGGAIDYNIRVKANYIVIDGFLYKNTQLSGVDVVSGAHHIFVQNGYQEEVGTAVTWGSAAVATHTFCHDIYILTNTFKTTADSSTLQGLNGIYILGQGNETIVVSDNTISGTFWDAFGNSVGSHGSGPMNNCDMARNKISGNLDDGVEMDGDAINMRIFANDFNSGGTDCISAAPVYVGPGYVFRNTLRGKCRTGALKLGIPKGMDGPVYFFHNTVDTPTSSDGITAAGGGPYKNVVFRNNIIKNKDKVITQGIGTSDDNSYDYACYGNYTANHFRVTWQLNEVENYTSLTSYRSAKNQDVHSFDAQGTSLWADALYHLLNNSPAVDMGILLPNFNDAKSAWPFAGVAPDAGAFEAGSPVSLVAPAPPPNLRFVVAP